MSAPGEAGGLTAPLGDPTDVLDTPAAGALVVRGGLVRIVGFGATLLLSLVGVVLMTRHLGVDDYGRYQAVLSLGMIVQTITDVGMAALGVREYSQRRGADRDELMRSLLGLRTLLTVTGAGLSVGVAAAIGFTSAMVGASALMGISVIVLVAQTTLQIPLQAGLRLTAVTLLDVGRQATHTVLIVALVLAGSGFVGFIGSLIVVNIVLTVATGVLVRRQIPMRPHFDPRGWLALLRPAAAFALAIALGTLYAYTALVLTQVVSNPHQTGLFSASFRVFTVALGVPGLIATAGFPVLARAARDDRERLVYATQRLFQASAVLGGAAAVIVVLAAHPIILLLAGHKFTAAAGALRIQGVAMLLSFVLAPWGFALLAMHRHRAMVIANAAAFVLSAATVLALAPSHGAHGAAVGTLVGEATLVIGYVIALIGEHRALQPPTGIVVRLAIAVGVGMALGLVPGVPDAAAAVAGAVAYGVLVFALKLIPVEVADLVPASIAAPLRRWLSP
jgi:O-antigen/teichoic acid export membrane protein